VNTKTKSIQKRVFALGSQIITFFPTAKKVGNRHFLNDLITGSHKYSACEYSFGECVKNEITREEALRRMNANADRIRSFGVKRVALFGSVARGDQRSDSDVDVLVEFERGKKTFDNYMDLKFFLENVFGRNVDLVVKEAIKPALRRSILDGAVYAA